KPDNILFRKTGIKICDYGLMTGIDQESVSDDTVNAASTTHTTDVRTLLYQSPEQKGNNYGSQTDIYAVGLILLEMFYDAINHVGLVDLFVDLKDCNKILKQLEATWPQVCDVIRKLVQPEPTRMAA